MADAPLLPPRPGSPSRAALGATILAGLALLASGSTAEAHRAPSGSVVPDGAIVIQDLSHGQMRVIADNQAAIMDLAARQAPTDPTMRRLEGFIELQRFACLWGAVPGSVTDEASPFNECAHAYLAGMRALLIHLRTMPGDKAGTTRLATRIELEMLGQGSSLIRCRYSDEPFDTARIIAPHWSQIPTHGPTSATLGGATVATLWVGLLALRRGPRQAAASKRRDAGRSDAC